MARRERPSQRAALPTRSAPGHPARAEVAAVAIFVLSDR
jgi:hypothetical protein